MVTQITDMMRSQQPPRAVIEAFHRFKVVGEDALNDGMSESGDESDSDSDSDYVYDGSDDEGSDGSGGDDDNDEALYNYEHDMEGEFLHAPIRFDSLHCPPLDDLPLGARECNCIHLGLYNCCREDNFAFFGDIIDFDAILQEAEDTVDDILRSANNLNRKRLYKSVFHRMDFGVLGEHERRELPWCICAKIRQVYPDGDGIYMGFREV